MANKRYDEFPGGTYDTAKIFLQADAVTGALEKINLPTIPSLYTGNTLVNANNTGSNPQAIASLVIPASALDTVGRTFIITAFGEILSTTGTPQMSATFETLGSLNLVGSVTGLYRFQYYVTRISGTQLKCQGWITRVNSFSASSNVFTVNLNTGNAGTFRLSVTAGGANVLFVLAINAIG